MEGIVMPRSRSLRPESVPIAESRKVRVGGGVMAGQVKWVWRLLPVQPSTRARRGRTRGGLDDRHDARPDRLGQLTPSINDEGQVGVKMDGSARQMRGK